MASIGENSMRKHLRACRRRQKRRVSTRTNPLSVNSTQSTGTRPTQDTSTGESDSVYLVEDIIGERIIKGQKYYKVRWQGFPPEADSWEPEENLSNVLEAINHYHHRRQTEELTKTGSDLVKDCLSGCANSPASLPTPPSTPGCSLAKRFRGASEERQSHPPGTKRKHGPKSRTSGRYEYVPKHELVASKTKYFDDIRDGKIDLSSNDLYSRVKTRRRITEASHTNTGTESVHSTSNSVQGDPEPDGETSMDPLPTCSVKREPSSPASDSMNAGGSLSGFQSTVDSTESEQLKPHLTDQIEALSEPISDMTQCYSIVELETPNEVPLRATVDCATQSDEHSFVMSASGVCIPSTSSSYHLKTTFVDVALSPIAFEGSNDEQKPDFPTRHSAMQAEDAESETANSGAISQLSDDTGPTVSSLRKLVQDYFRLIAYVQRTNSDASNSVLTDFTDRNNDIRSLEDLPRLVYYSPRVPLQTREEFVEAINAQRWSLLSTLANKQASEGTKTNTNMYRSDKLSPKWCDNTDRMTSRDLLIAALQAGADRPLVLDQLIRTGNLDPNEIIPDEGVQWPVLVYAVRLCRLHAVQALLDAGADPNSTEPGPRHRTALGVAIAAGDVDMAHMLILAGANFYEVETGTTALSLIMKLINAHTATPVQLSKLPPLSVAEAQDRRRSVDSELPSVPPPSPPPGFEIPTVPKSILFNAVIHSAATAGSGHTTPVTTTNPSIVSTAQHHQSHGNTKWHHHHHHSTSVPDDWTRPLIGLPSVDSLRRLYDLVAVHHARLSVRVAGLVRNWLTKAGLTQVGLVSPCQWIRARQPTASVCFTWPHPFHWSHSTTPKPIIPILLLVHGRLVPPACYDVWMDDDGPCLVESVSLDGRVEQKPLGRSSFASTLFPLWWDQTRSAATPGTNLQPQSHEVSVKFRSSADSGSFRPTCVALMVVAVTQNSGQPAGGTVALNSRGLLRPPPARLGLPASSRVVFGSPPHVSRQRSVS